MFNTLETSILLGGFNTKRGVGVSHDFMVVSINDDDCREIVEVEETDTYKLFENRVRDAIEDMRSDLESQLLQNAEDDFDEELLMSRNEEY